MKLTKFQSKETIIPVYVPFYKHEHEKKQTNVWFNNKNSPTFSQGLSHLHIATTNYVPLHKNERI